MELTEEQYSRIKNSLPVQRGNVRLTNLQVLNAILSRGPAEVQPGSIRGTMVTRFTRNATRSSDCSAGSKASVGSSHGLKSSTSSSGVPLIRTHI
jgi:hypothetical protein